MSTFVLLVVLLLFLVGLLVVGGRAYAVYRRLVLTQPLMVAMAAATVLVAMVTPVVAVGAP
ncbi:hypothetical protein [Streptomyces sp. NPDC021212]|uniref:hypothetical protein n=1 Tax=Streptomyces sp. NPDC021212 TaxID=3365118 RepID=UPI0037A4D9F3